MTLHFSKIFSFFLMISTPLLGSLIHEESKEAFPEITHIQLSPSPFEASEITVRLYLPGNNYIEADVGDTKKIIKLGYPIKSHDEDASYHQGVPFSVSDHTQHKYITKTNGEYQCAIWAFYTKNKKGLYEKGPVEQGLSGRLWPIDLDPKSVTSTLFLEITYNDDKYQLMSSFVTQDAFKLLEESLPFDDS